MVAVRNHYKRGRINMGWLKSYHTFSFGYYYNPKYKGYRDLAVINEDYVQPKQGFDQHPHENMEILTYVIAGTLKHQDSLGNSTVLHAGELQRLSAGTGILHSEYNDSSTEIVHFLQIWIKPQQMDLIPSYEQRNFQNDRRSNELILVASPHGKNNSLKIHQDVNVYLLNLDENHTVDYHLQAQRYAWLQVVKGSLNLDEHLLMSGDGVAISDQKTIKITGKDKSQILIFDLS